MENELRNQVAALRQAKEMGCNGAHLLPTGEWIPCSSTKQFLTLIDGFDVKSRMSLEEMSKWSSARKAKGKKRKKRWEKLRERRVLGIDTLQGGGLVSGNSRVSANAISGGSIPPMTYGNVQPPNISTKTIQPAYMPRDNDPDVFIDIESARKRAQQLGCIGVSRRISKGGKTVWMPCTNLTDYNNLTGMTALGRINQAKRNERVVRTVIKDELKRRKKSIPEEILGKSLGPKLRGIGRGITSRFDRDAVDGDNDGLLQDGTPFERPNAPTPQNAPKPTKTPEINNPEATPSNPFRNLGGRAMGAIIRGMVKPENKNKEDRKTFVLGGNTGSGKSTVFERHLVPNGIVPSEQEAAVIDPDFVKKGLVGYDDGDGAGIVHKESQVVTDKIIKDSAAEGMDMVIMGSGASRQLKHMREATARGESVIGHWVHIPQKKASQRIRTRMDETGRYIPDNTAHMAASIPRTVSSAFEEDLLEEFYLWDNDVPKGSPPKLIAQKVRGSKFEIFDKPKFEEFAGGKRWADTWVRTADDRESRRGGLASYNGQDAWDALKAMGFIVDYGKGKNSPNVKVTLPEGTPVRKFFDEKVKPFMLDKSGIMSAHKSRAYKDGEVLINSLLLAVGIDVDRKNLTDKRNIQRIKTLLLSSDPEELAKLFARAPISGPNGEGRFEDLKINEMGVQVGETVIGKVAERTGLSEGEISKLIREGFTEEEISRMSNKEIKELLDAIDE